MREGQIGDPRRARPRPGAEREKSTSGGSLPAQLREQVLQAGFHDPGVARIGNPEDLAVGPGWPKLDLQRDALEGWARRRSPIAWRRRRKRSRRGGCPRPRNWNQVSRFPILPFQRGSPPTARCHRLPSALLGACEDHVANRRPSGANTDHRTQQSACRRSSGCWFPPGPGRVPRTRQPACLKAVR